MNQSASIDHLNNAIGTIRVTASVNGVLNVELLGNIVKPLSILKNDVPHQAMKNASSAMEQIVEYLGSKRKLFALPIDWYFSTPFQKSVLEIAQAIPFGEVLTYGKIAEKLGKDSASRAVGRALGRNPMPIIIPCHRVVAANGNLTGFSAADGILTKQWLLELEGHKIVAQKLV